MELTMEFNNYLPRIILTLIAILTLVLVKHVVHRFVQKYGVQTQKAYQRMAQMQKIIAVILNILFIFAVAAIWGLKGSNFLVGLTTIFTILGVAMFAQWSILSNIAAGIIMYFTAPFRLGDRIHIIDKDMPITATIENILTFYTHLRTDEGELIVIPNNLFLQKMVALKNEDENEQ